MKDGRQFGKIVLGFLRKGCMRTRFVGPASGTFHGAIKSDQRKHLRIRQLFPAVQMGKPMRKAAPTSPGVSPVRWWPRWFRRCKEIIGHQLRCPGWMASRWMARRSTVLQAVLDLRSPPAICRTADRDKPTYRVGQRGSTTNPRASGPTITSISPSANRPVSIAAWKAFRPSAGW